MPSHRARWMWKVRAGVGIVAATGLLSFSVAQAASPRHAAPARAASGSAPVLGAASIAPSGAGFGKVKPRTVSYGGDPTSFVVKVTWHSWGGGRAVGHGKADWVWPGWCVACGSVELPATVVAFGRTTCQGHSAYSHVEWYFPSRGMSFNERLGPENICNGHLSSIGSTKARKCGRASLQSHGSTVAVAENIASYGSSMSCSSVRRFVAGSGAGRYIARNARFSTHGWWCGSELSMDMGGPQSFTCVRGDFRNVSFDLKPAGG